MKYPPDTSDGKQKRTQDVHGLSGRTEVLSRLSLIDSAVWELGLADSIDTLGLKEQIPALARNSFPPNPFFDIPFLDAALARIGKDQKRFLYLTETIGGQTELKMFAPVTLETCRTSRLRFARIWTHEYAPNSLPLLDTDLQGSVEKQFINTLVNAEHPHISALAFDLLPAESRFSKSLYEAPILSERLYRFSPARRAALLPGKRDTYENTVLSGKRRQRLRRAMERLQELGKVEFESVSRFSDVLLRFEEFLLLETSGWKGRRGTSMQRIKKTAAFARQAVANMADENRCSIHSLRVNEKAVSSMILFNSDGWFYPWKIAFNEACSGYSVGNLLLVHVNKLLLNHPGFKGIDSLAASDNETANRFWPDRINLHSMVIGIGKNAQHDAAAISWEIKLKQDIKSRLKQLLIR